MHLCVTTSISNLSNFYMQPFNYVCYHLSIWSENEKEIAASWWHKCLQGKIDKKTSHTRCHWIYSLFKKGPVCSYIKWKLLFKKASRLLLFFLIEHGCPRQLKTRILNVLYYVLYYMSIYIYFLYIPPDKRQEFSFSKV